MLSHLLYGSFFQTRYLCLTKPHLAGNLRLRFSLEVALQQNVPFLLLQCVYRRIQRGFFHPCVFRHPFVGYVIFQIEGIFLVAVNLFGKRNGVAYGVKAVSDFETGISISLAICSTVTSHRLSFSSLSLTCNALYATSLTPLLTRREFDSLR